MKNPLALNVRTVKGSQSFGTTTVGEQYTHIEVLPPAGVKEDK